MKNVIFLVCDGLSYGMVENYPNHQSPMKFLNSLRKESVWCSKAYSQGPYTESAIMSLCYGRSPLDQGSYLFGFQKFENSIFEAFYNKGYDLFTSYFASYTPIDLLLKGNYVYNINNSNPNFSLYIRSKLDYYYNLFCQKQLQENDYTLLERLLYYHFQSMLIYQSDKALKNDWTGDNTPFVINDIDYKERVIFFQKRVKCEYDKYLSSPRDYILSVFENYDNHFITTSCNIKAPKFSERARMQRNFVYSNYNDLFSCIKKKNKKAFIRNSRIPFRGLRNSFKKGGREFFAHCYRIKQAFSELNLSKICTSNDTEQICTSAGAFLDSLYDWIIDRKNENPFFSYLHFDEFHRPLSFYSHDIFDRERICQELDKAKEYVDCLSDKYDGNILFDLAALYLDNMIEKFVNKLDEIGILKDTIIVITADHGSSNFGGEVRSQITNNFFDEQYHIPCIIIGLDENKTINTYTNGLDIPYTILDYLKMEIPSTFTGSNILKTSRRETFVEYLGTGVPDLLRKPILYQIRNDEYSIVLSGLLFSDAPCKIIESHYLQTDPKELIDISQSIDEKIKKSACSMFNEERLRLQNEFVSWLKN